MGNPPRAAIRQAFGEVALQTTQRFLHLGKLLIPFAFFDRAAAASQNEVTSSNQTWDEAVAADNVIYRDVVSMSTLFNFTDYQLIGRTIRAGNRLECFGNLSIALSNIGPIASTSGNGSSGALTLLPTAGALIGAPAKELWILFKLVPLAGILSMFLSLGGNILPNASGDYEGAANRYDGIIGNNMDEEEARLLSVKDLSAVQFAEVVSARAQNPLGGSNTLTVGFGMLCQLGWIGIIIFACWFTEQGAIVAWWCKGWGWMIGWYGCVVLSALFENSALVPFTKQWTMRVSNAPGAIEISEDAPSAVPFLASRSKDKDSGNDIESSPRNGLSTSALMQEEDRDMTVNRAATGDTLHSHKSVADEYRNYAPVVSRHRSEFLHNLDKYGFNTTGRIYIDPTQPWASSNRSFLVIVSVSGINHIHAALRVASKAISIAVFAGGTAAFASATLVTISVTLTVLCLILGAGVFGRVASLWMVARMMKENPVIHKVVHSEPEAEDFIHHILATPGLTVELMGHVFINGKCVKRYNRWFNWQNLFGILASPYNLHKLRA